MWLMNWSNNLLELIWVWVLTLHLIVDFAVSAASWHRRRSVVKWKLKMTYGTSLVVWRMSWLSNQNELKFKFCKIWIFYCLRFQPPVGTVVTFGKMELVGIIGHSRRGLLRRWFWNVIGEIVEIPRLWRLLPQSDSGATLAANHWSRRHPADLHIHADVRRQCGGSPSYGSRCAPWIELIGTDLISAHLNWPALRNARPLQFFYEPIFEIIK